MLGLHQREREREDIRGVVRPTLSTFWWADTVCQSGVWCLCCGRMVYVLGFDMTYYHHSFRMGITATGVVISIC